VFVTVTAKREPRVPPLEEVKDRVREDAIRERATEIGRQRAAAIAASLRSAGNFAAAAKAQGFEAKDTDLIARGMPLPDVGVSPEVEKAVFGLPAGSVSEPITTRDATVIVRVTDRDDVTPEELRLGKEAFREQLLNERRARFFAAYMAKAKERMDIEVKQDVVTRMLAATAI
jgi:parvulin-like peptidyl-prolyl isomerase